MKLDELPTVILLLIVDYVHTDTSQLHTLLEHDYKKAKAYGDGLLPLKLTNKSLEVIANRAAFRKIVIGIKNACQLVCDITAWFERLQRRRSLSYVTHLELRGHGPELRKTDMEQHYADKRNMDTDCGLQRSRNPFGRDWLPDCYASAIDNKHQGWARLAQLVQSLPNLHRITCECKHQLSPTVLATTTGQRHISVHVKSLRLGNAIEAAKKPTMPSYQVRFLQHPSLHSVNIDYKTHINPYSETIVGDAAGIGPAYELYHTLMLAPRVRELSMVVYNAGSYRPAASMEGLEAMAKSHEPKVRLRRFELDGTHGPLWQPLWTHTWLPLVDWTGLRELVLNTHLDDASMADLSQIDLPCLERLYLITSASSQRTTPHTHALQRLQDVGTWLVALPTLLHLELKGCLSSDLFSKVVRHHGSSLRTLKLLGDLSWSTLSFVAHKAQAEELVAYCKHLETLSMTTARSESNADEAFIYETLGQLPMLQDLHLTLCVWPHVQAAAKMRSGVARDVRLQLQAQPQRISEMPHVLRNAYMTCDLLSSIYCCLHSKRPQSSPPLRKCRFEVDMHYELVPPAPGHNLTALFAWMLPKWSFTQELGGVQRSNHRPRGPHEARSLQNRLKDDDFGKRLVLETWPGMVFAEDGSQWLDLAAVPLEYNFTGAEAWKFSFKPDVINDVDWRTFTSAPWEYQL